MTNVLINPNQADLPIVMKDVDASEVIAGARKVSCVNGEVLNVGDKFLCQTKSFSYEVIEAATGVRPAKGDFSGDKWEGVTPLYMEVIVKIVKTETAQAF